MLRFISSFFFILLTTVTEVTAKDVWGWAETEHNSVPLDWPVFCLKAIAANFPSHIRVGS